MAEHSFENLVEILQNSVERFASNDLFGEKKHGAWSWMSYQQFGKFVDELRAGLSARGVTAGTRVAIIANNRSEWAIGAYACYSLGAAYVPMYEAQLDKDWEYILQDSGAKVLFVSKESIAQKIAPMRERLASLEHVVVLDAPSSDPNSFGALCALGAKAPVPAISPEGTTLAGLIYTSGTTGNPKGVMLSHANLAKNVSAIHEIFPMAVDDRSLSFLPWAHSFGQTVELHCLFSMGASMAIAESVDKLMDNMKEVRPTLLFSVPRIFHRIYDGLTKRMETEKPAKRKLFYHALSVSSKRRKLASVGLESRWLDTQHALLDRLVFSTVRERFGGRLKYAFSGGAAIAKEVAEFIDDLGITVYEGYGLTETSPIATANCPGRRKLGSVGRPIPGTRIEIDHSKNTTEDPNQGEIICHGHNVMLGYYNLPEENKAVFTANGGFRTGDLGYVDPEGFLFITGRVKEQYKLENGKYVAPVPIEHALQLSPFVANAMVHGMNKPFNIVVLVPDFEKLNAWAAERHLPIEREVLLTHPDVRALYAKVVEEQSRELKHFERPKAFLLAAEDFSLANDQLTPSLKLKRRNVVQRYSAEIEALYANTEDR